jgi:3-deoxy-D-arabino-heptulosonate 7-phosphate (DAHP) synthase
MFASFLGRRPRLAWPTSRLEEHLVAVAKHQSSCCRLTRLGQGTDNASAGGATMARGGAYEPRTSPHSFQGPPTA